MKTIIVWYRNDLRVHDHPALSAAATDADHVIPVFIFNDGLLHGKHSGANRTRFLLESLADLKASLTKAGANLVIRHGKPASVLATLAKEHSAEAVYYTADYTPYAVHRDKAVKQSLEAEAVQFRAYPGRLIVSTLDKLQTKSNTVHKVFTPFFNNWRQIGRRELAGVPRKLTLPNSITIGALPKLDDIAETTDLSPDVLKGGETAGRKRLKTFLDGPIMDYTKHNNDMAADATSRLSAYFHFGCISPLEVETMLPIGAGADAWHRQLCWRDFYHYVMFHNPDNAKQEFQERFRSLKWPKNTQALHAWQDGQTGFPVVDAAMRQLNQEGWMHNRARLIVGSFLTKDLWLDWRAGETYFMRKLIDGDESNNNGNWQWIASVGVDPAPVFRRFYNPSSQRDKYDPTGAYVRRYVPELKDVPDKYLTEPWTMPEDVQHEVGCVIGTDYPAPIVDHKAAREFALEKYRQAG